MELIIRILALVVDKDFRDVGIAKKMIERVGAWVKEMKTTTLSLNCKNREERSNTYLVYKHIGF